MKYVIFKIMIFSELLLKIKQLKLNETRKDTNNFLEFVILKESLASLTSLLEKHFGPPTKPSIDSPSKKILQDTAPYGGIDKGQTLYSLSDQNSSYFALLWPWSDNKLITVKVIQDKKKPETDLTLKGKFLNCFRKNN